MMYLKWLMSPLGKLMGLVMLVLTLLGTIFLKGRSQGVEAERDRSKKVTKKVQGKMDKETEKQTTTKETVDRLNDGTF